MIPNFLCLLAQIIQLFSWKMMHFEVKVHVYHHKIASFKEICVVVLMLGDEAQTYHPSPPPPKKKRIIRKRSPVGDIFELCQGGCQIYAVKSSVTGYSFL